jgi:hypothetical protein
MQNRHVLHRSRCSGAQTTFRLHSKSLKKSYNLISAQKKRAYHVPGQPHRECSKLIQKLLFKGAIIAFVSVRFRGVANLAAIILNKLGVVGVMGAIHGRCNSNKCVGGSKILYES